jgi:hypothetical protein
LPETVISLTDNLIKRLDIGFEQETRKTGIEIIASVIKIENEFWIAYSKLDRENGLI